VLYLVLRAFKSKSHPTGLASGEREIALLWAAALAAYGVRTKVEKVGSAFQIIVSGGDAVKLAGLYFLYGPPCLKEAKGLSATSLWRLWSWGRRCRCG